METTDLMQGNIVAYEGKPVYVVALHNYDDVGADSETKKGADYRR